jgi:hypothetical protein
LGCDDRLFPEYWETLLPLFSKPDIGFVRVGCMQFSDADPTGSWWKPPALANPIDIFEANKVFITSPVRVEMMKDIGYIDTQCVWGDWDTWMRAIVKGWKWANYDKPMFWYRRRMDSETYKQPHTKDSQEFQYLRNKWKDTFKKFGVKRSMLFTEEELQ